ncbi:hypothetical protein AAEX28_04455 [Lentisphaerota bacterium WC36G]|nr:hypothetical protein LJT99_07320 [Lentisphaerae bacterium WC36]
MIYYESDFVDNTNVVLGIIQNLNKDIKLTVNVHGMEFEQLDSTYSMQNFHDLRSLNSFFIKYFMMTNSQLRKKFQRKEKNPISGKMEYSNIEDFTLEELIDDQTIDFTNSNLDYYIKLVKASKKRYNPTTNELDHIPEQDFFKQLCLFRYLFGHFFTNGLSPLSADRFYFAFRKEFCPNFEGQDNQGLAQAIIATAEMSKATINFNGEIFARELSYMSHDLDQAIAEREAVIQQYIDRLQLHKQQAKFLEGESQINEHRKAVGTKLLGFLAHYYAYGMDEVYLNSPYSEVSFCIPSSRYSEMKPHGPETFYAIFSPTFFEYPCAENSYKSLKENYNSENFFIIIGEILESCHAKRNAFKGLAGRVRHWRGDYQYDTLAKAVIEILNSDFGKYVLYLDKGQKVAFHWNQFTKLPPTFKAFEYDYPTAYRRAFAVMSDLEYAKSQIASINQQVEQLDRRVFEVRDDFDAKIDETVTIIAQAHDQYLHKKVLRRLSSSQERALQRRRQRVMSQTSERSDSTSEATADEEVFSASASRMMRRNSSHFKELRAKRSFHDARPKSRHQRIIDELTGNEDDDFLCCLKYIINYSGNYADLIEIRNQLYLTYLAREVKISVHATWTGEKRRKCTKYWSHIERIIQILALTNMISRSVQLANISRICDHYFFLIMARHSAIVIKEHRKKTCGMATRYFTALRAKQPEKALEELDQKWQRYIDLYNMPPMNKMDVLAERNEIERSRFPSICEELENPPQ